jgi:nicotinate phosphoribosyltransferase
MNSSDLPLPSQDLGLFTDLYELTMAQTFYQQGMFAPATFSLFIRRYPANRGYLVSAGLEDVLDYLENLYFSPASLDYLNSTSMFTGDFLEYLGSLRFTGSVRAIPEGRLFFANEPVLEVTAPIIEAQIAETFIINQINLQTLLATKAARCVWAAQGRPIADFASRRTHGTDAALKMARCSYIGGFQSTSNVLATQRYGIPPSGTMAHSFISSFLSEKEAFRAYAQTFPDHTTLLLDTYDTIEGAWRAVEVAKEMEAAGHQLAAVRLDSGDLDTLSRQVRRILDDSALDYVKILASGGLDEYKLEELVQHKAPIDLFGVGTRAGVSNDAPYTDMAYKLVCYDQRPLTKLSAGKSYLPGAKQVFRLRDSQGRFFRDVIGREDEDLPGGEALLNTVMLDGRRTMPDPALIEIHERFVQDFQRLDDHHKRLSSPPPYPVAVSPRLEQLAAQIHAQIMSTEGLSSG